MANPDLPDLDADEHEVRTGRTFGYTIVGDWVLLNPDLSDRAVRIYCLLRMHCKGDKRHANPAQTTLADMLGIKKTDGIGKAIQELVGIGAVEIEVVKHRSGRRNTYVVNEAPPASYDHGPLDRSAYYDARRRKREAEAAAAEGVPPDSGVTPKAGVMDDPRSRGDGSPPIRGSEGVQEEGLQGGAQDSSIDAASAASPPVTCAAPRIEDLEDPEDQKTERLVEWLDAEVTGFEPGEEAMSRSMLGRGCSVRFVLNKIRKDRRAPIEQRERVGVTVGGFLDGEADLVDYLIYCKYSDDEIVEGVMHDRRRKGAA